MLVAKIWTTYGTGAFYSVAMQKNRLPIEERIAKNLVSLRVKANMTQKQVAQMADVHPRYIQAIETGNRNPSIGVVERLKNGLACGWEELLGD